MRRAVLSASAELLVVSDWRYVWNCLCCWSIANGLAVHGPARTEHTQVSHVYCVGDKRADEHRRQADWYEHDTDYDEHPQSAERREHAWRLEHETQSHHRPAASPGCVEQQIINTSGVCPTPLQKAPHAPAPAPSFVKLCLLFLLRFFVICIF